MQRQRQEYRSRQRDRHAIARFDAPCAQTLGQRYHLLAHLTVAKLPAAIRQRRGIRGFCRLRRHQRAQGGERQVDSGRVHLRQALVFRRRQHIRLAAGQSGIIGKLSQQRR